MQITDNAGKVTEVEYMPDAESFAGLWCPSCGIGGAEKFILDDEGTTSDGGEPCCGYHGVAFVPCELVKCESCSEAYRVDDIEDHWQDCWGNG
jgi:hypothetical protein